MTKRTFARELALINKGRVVLGYKPLVRIPKGVPNDPKYCPINRAMRSYATSDNVDLAENTCYPTDKEYNRAKSLAKVWKTNVIMDAEVKLPQILSDFVSNFDDLKYPELVLE